MKYVAINKFDETDNISGFNSEQEAWDYIEKNHLCVECNELLEYGYMSYEFGEEGLMIIDHVSETDCGKEWVVLTETNVHGD